MNQECSNAAETIPPLLDGELTRREAASAVAHLSDCCRCLKESQAQALSWLAFEDAHPAPPAPAALRLWRPQPTPVYLRRPVWALAAAVALVLIVAPSRMRRPLSQERLVPVLKHPVAALSQPPRERGVIALAAPPAHSGEAALAHPPLFKDGGPALSAAPLPGEFAGAVPVLEPRKPRRLKTQRRQA